MEEEDAADRRGARSCHGAYATRGARAGSISGGDRRLLPADVPSDTCRVGTERARSHVHGSFEHDFALDTARDATFARPPRDEPYGRVRREAESAASRITNLPRRNLQPEGALDRRSGDDAVRR